MAKIIFLGTSASIPSHKRDNASFLFVYKKNFFLIDCPGSIVYKLKKVGVNYKKIHNIIITHHHPDHLYGLPHFIHTLAYTKTPLYIFSNKKTITIIKKTIKLFGLNKKDFPCLHYIDVFRKEIFLSQRGLKLKAIPNKHISESFGILFLWKNKSLLYSSDTTICSGIIQTAHKSTYLIHDCTASSYFFKKYPSLYKMHTDAKSLAQICSGKLPKKIIPFHFLLLNRKEENKIKKELKPLKDKLIYPCDFYSITL